MSVIELRDQLALRLPSRDIAVSETAYSHSFSNAYTEFVISIQPGFDGHLSQNFGGNSLDECLEKFNKASFPNL